MTQYYVVRNDDRFDLRQTRFKEQWMQGVEHPHDLVAVGFTAEGMRKLIDQYYHDDADVSVLNEAQS